LIYEYKGYQPPEKGWAFSRSTMEEWDAAGKLYFPADKTQRIRRKTFLDDYEGQPLQNFWGDIYVINSQAKESLSYPTQKPEALIERIISISSNPGDIVFDCFMGSGTTQAAAMKLGRRFLGADINLGAIQTTTKRLVNRAKELASDAPLLSSHPYTGFEVYNVNDYDFFRNELEAKRRIIEALGMQALPENNLWDAELDGRMVAILGINRIATAAEFSKIVNNIDIGDWTRRQAETPNKPIEKITFVCMGHDPNLKAMFIEEMQKLGFKVDLEIVDILRDKKDLTFKRDSDARIKISGNNLSITDFYPMNLLQKLSIQCEDVSDWKELVDSVMIDWNYDGTTFSPSVTDIPAKNEMVKGVYEIPKDAGTIHVKITDLLSESWEGSFEA
jgi:site-specific DNA-methyltransferase (adenine-specific)/adenine-specific DNA-methyltransferase